MTAVALIGLAAICAFFAGRFAERARTAHELYSTYKARVNTQLTRWIKDTFMTVVISLGVIAFVLAALMH
jgi:hypothetical protein